ncbi:MAG: hypothetical protein RLZZ387_4611 [Chloroflexota bacterium]|jgi:PAB1-binding protein PBP1
MNQRALLAAAAAVTAFVLVLFAVVLPGLSSSSAAPAPTTISAPADVSPVMVTQPQAAPTAAEPQTVPVSYTVSADQAGSLALTTATGATLAGTPELVTYQGVVAYEVPLSTGFAYVDAMSGQVLATPGATGTTSGGGEGGEHEGGEHEGGEHEGGEHDDDD